MSVRASIDRLRLHALQRLCGRTSPTAADVYFAYRLILGRDPDDEGWHHHLSQVRKGRPLRGLSETFLRSPEFAATWGLRVSAADYEARPIVEQVVDLGDFTMVVDRNDEMIGRVIAERRFWEPLVSRAVRELLRPGDTFVDVGANVGYFTLLAARVVGPSGRVLAFEPVRYNYELLEKSVAANALDNVELYRAALLDENRPAEMIQWERRNSGSFHMRNDPSWKGALHAVEGRRFDDLAGERRVDLVKIDVEGAEWLVVQGMTGMLRRDRPPLLVEFTPSSLGDLSGISGEGFLNELACLGYGAVDIESYDGRFRAKKPAELTKLLRRRGTGHLDLLCMNSDGRSRPPV